MASNELIKPLHGLRGIAALTVVVGHFAPIKGAAPLGVVLFFVLSGFLIAKLYLEKEFSALAVWNYSVARIARVYPLFALVVCLAAALNWWFPEARIFKLAPAETGRHLLLAGSANTVWTVAAEFQFYALFIVFWWLRGEIRRPLRLLLLLLVLSIAAAAWLGTNAGRINVMGYLHIFVLGMIVARVTDSVAERFRYAASFALPCLGMAYGAAFLVIPHVYSSRWAFLDPFAITICTLIVACAVAARDCWTNRILSLPVFLWLGELSFSVYLLHRIVQWAFGATVGFHPGWAVGPLMILVTLVLAQIANVVIEKPFRARLRHVGAGIERRLTQTATA